MLAYEAYCKVVSSITLLLHNSIGWLPCCQNWYLFTFDDLLPAFKNCSSKSSFLLSFGFSIMAFTIALLVNRFKSPINNSGFSSLELLKTKWIWLVIIHQANTSIPFFCWQCWRLSIRIVLYSFLVNTSSHPTTAKLIKYTPSWLLNLY